ncbi:MAG: hypothetical protein ACRCW9_06425 [Cetobacterium sp.]
MENLDLIQIYNKQYYINHEENEIYNSEKKLLFCVNKEKPILIYKNNFFKLLKFDQNYIVFYKKEVLYTSSNIDNLSFSEKEITIRAKSFSKISKEKLFKPFKLSEVQNKIILKESGIYSSDNKRISFFQFEQLLKEGELPLFAFNNKNEVIDLKKEKWFYCSKDKIYFSNFILKEEGYNSFDCLELSNYNYEKTKKFNFIKTNKEIIYFNENKVIKNWIIEENDYILGTSYLIGNPEEDFIIIIERFMNTEILDLNKKTKTNFSTRIWELIKEKISKEKLLIKTPDELFKLFKTYELIEKIGG